MGSTTLTSSYNAISRRTLLSCTGAVGALALMGAPALRAQARERGITGQLAPPLQLDWWIDANGKSTQFEVSEAKGKWLYLKFWQSWCPGCHKHGLPALKTFVDTFKDEPRVMAAGVQTVFEGFSFNSRTKVRKTQLEYGLPIAMGHDAGYPDGQHLPRTMVNYRSGGTPWVVIVNPSGRVMYDGFHINVEKLTSFIKDDLKRA